MNKIVIATDSFKGCLSSKEVAAGIADGIRKVYPHCEIVCVSIADGGEGFCQAFIDNKQGVKIETTVHDPLMRPIAAEYAIIDSKTTIIESAQASGLPLLAEGERNPLITSTYGTGELIKDAIAKGCRNIVIGLGGSATNDGGLGMLMALGYRFYDSNGNPLLQQGGQVLEQIAHIDTLERMPELVHCTFTIACDVDNPFIGDNGATNVYALQKGATQKSLEVLEKNMRHWCTLLFQHTGIDLSTIKGSGAAGGLAGAFIALLNAKTISGIDYVLNSIDFDHQIMDADLVITGEGRIDRQTLMGKAPQGILRRTHNYAIPTIALVGSVAEASLPRTGFDGIFPIQAGPISLKEAMTRSIANENLTRTIEQLLLFHKGTCHLCTTSRNNHT